MHAVGVSKRKTQPLSGWESQKKQENKTKLFLFGNKAWHDQHRFVVVAGRAVHQPVKPDLPIRPDPTQRPIDESDCPWKSGSSQLILKFSFTGRFRVPWLLTSVNRRIRTINLKKKKNMGYVYDFSFRVQVPESSFSKNEKKFKRVHSLSLISHSPFL